MVRGLDLFRERFREFEGSFILIGGAACDEWFTASGLVFRATKDLDLVLVEECRRNVGRCAPKHIRQDQDAFGASHAFKRLFDHGGRHVDIIVPSQRNGRDVMDLTHNHFRRIQKLEHRE